MESNATIHILKLSLVDQICRPSTGRRSSSSGVTLSPARWDATVTSAGTWGGGPKPFLTNALLLVSETQLIQLRVPGAVQGRLFGAKDTIEGACFLFGLLGAGALVATAGVRVTLASGAGICGVCALVAIATVHTRAPEPAPAPGAGVDVVH